MTDVFPTWTAYEKGTETHQGLNPLGLEPLGAAISRRLLPGITNATVHIRYFSFLSWVFWTFTQFHEGHGRTVTLDRRAQKRWRIRLENIHRSATLLEHPSGFTGLVGVEKARRLDPDSGASTIDMSGDEASTPFQAAYYSASFALLGCGEVQNDLVRLTPLGVRLGAAFDAGLRQARGSDAALGSVLRDADRIPVQAMRTLSKGMTLGPLQVGTQEHSTLIEMLFRFEAPQVDTDIYAMARRRGRCLGLLLELVRQARGRLATPYDLHDVFASGKFADGSPVEVPAAFENEFALWRRFQERQWQKLGINVVWEEVLDSIGSSIWPPRGETIKRELCGLADRSQSLRAWVGEDGLGVAVGSATDRAARRAAALARSQASPIQSLAAEVTDEEAGSERLGQGIVALLLVVAHWKRIRDQIPPEQRWPHRAQEGPGRLPLDWFVSQTEQRAQGSLRSYLEWLVDRCIIDQANRVALEKLAAGQYRFFILRDTDGFRIVKRRDPGASLSIDSRRFPAAYELLAGLNMVELRNGLDITAAGRAVLQREIRRSSSV